MKTHPEYKENIGATVDVAEISNYISPLADLSLINLRFMIDVRHVLN